VLAASIIALMMEAASTSETSVNFYQTTWRNSSEDSHQLPVQTPNTKVKINLLSNFGDAICGRKDRHDVHILSPYSARRTMYEFKLIPVSVVSALKIVI
jgi:hypothetical protein